MKDNSITRRKFLKTSGVVISSVVLAGSGLTLLDDHEPVDPFPIYSIGDQNMSKRILVTYASRTGSTAGVAEVIGQTLSNPETRVDIFPITEVKDLSPYNAVVAGSAIQGGEWLPEALDFVREHRSEFSRIPFAAFIVCMTLAMKKGDYGDQVKTWLNPVRTLVKPAREGFFAGSLDIAKIPSFADRMKFRLSVMAGVWSEGDHRDWHAIRTWAEDLTSVL
jgi:menaquinone-dependent protoporphyrinogen oxidase